MKSSRKALLLILFAALHTQVLFAEHGVFNTRAMYFDTEELRFPEWDNRSTPWANPSAYRQNNPVLDWLDQWTK